MIASILSSPITKKGTVHLTFKNAELLKKFNIFGSQRKAWLPPCYGKKHYNDMTDEEKRVIDEFDGSAVEYEKIFADKGYYLAANKLLVLTGK